MKDAKNILRAIRLTNYLLLWSNFEKELLDIKHEKVIEPEKDSRYEIAIIFTIKDILQSCKEDILTDEEKIISDEEKRFWLNLPAVKNLYERMSHWLSKGDQEIINTLTGG